MCDRVPVITVQARAGRSLALEIYGAPTGTPVMWFHGIPSSRIGARILHEQALTRDVSLIVPDRPGYGCSDPDPERTVMDWPEDVRVIAEALGLERFSVLGVSGGFQYVAATAVALPERIHRVGTISAMPPLRAPGVLVGLDPRMRFLYELGVRQPRVARLWLSSIVRSDPRRVVRRQLRLLDDTDRRILSDPVQTGARVADLYEAARQGTPASQLEGQMYAERWPFELADLTIPFHLWQGELDRTHPPVMGRYLAEEIPCAVMHWRPGVGGLFYLNDFGSVLDELLAGPA